MSHQNIDDALSILRQLGLSKKQQNTRSALTLLALLDLKPGDAWKSAKNPLCGITPMMDFFAEHYGKKYAPNSRETVRRQTIHQFLQASLIVENPDDPDRPTNSGKTVYQINPKILMLIQYYGRKQWKTRLERYLVSHPPFLPSRMATTYTSRDDAVSISISNVKTISLSAGRHNELVRDIFDKFIPRFTEEHVPIYVGDTAKKFAYFDEALLSKLGVRINPHGKMPDIIIYDTERKWIFVIEAVTSHGPVDEKRRNELKEMFSGAVKGIVYVTAFADMKTMRKYASDISWETEVWVAEFPDHMIHFDGERFMGPYGYQ